MLIILCFPEITLKYYSGLLFHSKLLYYLYLLQLVLKAAKYRCVWAEAFMHNPLVVSGVVTGRKAAGSTWVVGGTCLCVSKCEKRVLQRLFVWLTVLLFNETFVECRVLH